MKYTLWGVANYSIRPIIEILISSSKNKKQKVEHLHKDGSRQSVHLILKHLLQFFIEK